MVLCGWCPVFVMLRVVCCVLIRCVFVVCCVVFVGCWFAWFDCCLLRFVGCAYCLLFAMRRLSFAVCVVVHRSVLLVVRCVLCVVLVLVDCSVLCSMLCCVWCVVLGAMLS